MRKIVLVCICASSLLFQSNAISCEGHDGWATVEIGELMKEGWRRHSPTGFGQVRLDMNGDGIDDHAFLVVSQDEARSAVKVCLGSSGSRVGGDDGNCRVFAESENIYSVMGLEKRNPGCYEFHEDEAGNSFDGRICSKSDALEYFRFGSSSSFFVYDEKSGDFHRYWDSY